MAGNNNGRLTNAIGESLSPAAIKLTVPCSPYHGNSPPHPVIGQLERELRFDKSDDAARKLDKLDAALAEHNPSVADTAPLIAALLSLEAEDRYPAVEVSPQMFRRKSLEAVLAMIEAKAAEMPLLVLVEDAHWIDPSTVELLGLLVERLKDATLLLLIVGRPEFDPPWASHPQLTTLRLNRLSRKESAAIVTKVAGKSLPDEVVEQIVARTDGVVLFVEELTKSVLESELLVETDDAYTVIGSLPALAIPASLHDSLMARLDRLGTG